MRTNHGILLMLGTFSLASGCADAPSSPDAPSTPADPYVALVHAYEDAITTHSLADYLALLAPDCEVVLPEGHDPCTTPWLEPSYWSAAGMDGCGDLVGVSFSPLSRAPGPSGETLFVHFVGQVLWSESSGAQSDLFLLLTVVDEGAGYVISRVEVRPASG